MYKLVFVRHGKTSWADKFTGWTDVDVSPEGIQVTKKFARRLTDAGFRFDIAYTSYLKRAIRTLWTTLDEIDQMHIPVMTSWQLNERHYGALQGLNKAETAAKYGDSQVAVWRRSFDTPPPVLEVDDPRHPRYDKKYASIEPGLLPAAESLKDTIVRTVPYWEETIVPQVTSGKSVIISAHGNSIRAIAKHVEGISNEAIMGLNIAYSIPLVYEFDQEMKFIKKYYLATDAEVDTIISEIKSQGKSK
jgi:2,3-bisphosphoglycerate-dependent phosphoglycerate mutase